MFSALTHSILATSKIEKKEIWESWKQIQDRFGDDAIAHIHSGRLRSRESTTKGVWEYMDTENISETKAITKTKELKIAQEHEAAEADMEGFNLLFDSDMGGSSFSSNTGMWAGASKGKGKGKPHRVEAKECKPTNLALEDGKAPSVKAKEDDALEFMSMCRIWYFIQRFAFLENAFGSDYFCLFQLVALAWA